MKKCAILLLFLFSIRAHGQWYGGFEAGGTRNYLITTNGGEPFTSYQGATGIAFDIPVLFRVNDWLALESGAGFEHKDYRMVRSGFFQGVWQQNSNGYLQMPLLGNCSFGGKKIRGFIKLGIYGAYWLTARIKGTSANILGPTDTTTLNPTALLEVNNGYNYNQRYSFSGKDNRIEIGWLAGAGISYQVNRVTCIFLEGRYTSAITDQQKKYQLNQTPRFNSTYGISIGTLFALKHIL